MDMINQKKKKNYITCEDYDDLIFKLTNLWPDIATLHKITSYTLYTGSI